MVMRCSANELKTVISRAARAYGLPFGVAADIGAAGVWLTRCGHDGVSAVFAGLDGVAAGGGKPALLNDSLDMRDAPVAVYGAAALDCLAARVAVRAEWCAIDAPLLLLGFAALAAVAYDLPLCLSTDTGDVRVVPGAAVCPSTPLSLARYATVTPLEETALPAVDADFWIGDIAVCDKHWEKLSMLAKHTYVANDAQTRATAAGAGLTDND